MHLHELISGQSWHTTDWTHSTVRNGRSAFLNLARPILQLVHALQRSFPVDLDIVFSNKQVDGRSEAIILKDNSLGDCVLD